ncbi:MAG: Bug family tripartite tricarboxylate transporter substrate binding protein [Burkholderiales bacterium]
MPNLFRRFVWRFVPIVASALGCVLMVPLAFAQAYPSKPVRIITPAPPGSAPDFLLRIMSPKFSELWGHPVIVDNIVGASGHIGTERVAKSAPDGYTLLFNTIGPIAINMNLFDKLPFDPIKDFMPISLVAKVPNILCVHPGLPVKTLVELIDYARKNPEKLRYGSAGSGTTPHLSGELFSAMTGTKLVHVPYKSSAQMTTDTIGGQVEVIWHNAPVVLPHVKAGTLRGLAITSDKRNDYAPELPTHDEAGVPGYEVTAWFGIMTPTGTPQAVISKVHADIVKIVNMPDVKERFLSQAAAPVGNTPEEFAAFIRTEIDKWSKVIKKSGAKVD